ALELSRSVREELSETASASALTRMLLSVLQDCANGFSTGLELQLNWSGRGSAGPGPFAVVNRVVDVVDNSFPRSEWNGRVLPKESSESILRPYVTAKGSESERGQPLEM